MNHQVKKQNLNIDQSDQANKALPGMNTSTKTFSDHPSCESTPQLLSLPPSLPKISPVKESKATQTEEKRINEEEELRDEIITLALTWLHI